MPGLCSLSKKYYYEFTIFSFNWQSSFTTGKGTVPVLYPQYCYCIASLTGFSLIRNQHNADIPTVTEQMIRRTDLLATS
jgi:hypothetical protein